MYSKLSIKRTGRLSTMQMFAGNCRDSARVFCNKCRENPVIYTDFPCNKNLKVPEKPKLKWFYIQWSKTLQHASTANKGNQRPKCLQNRNKKLDMGKHPFVLVTNFNIYFL